MAGTASIRPLILVAHSENETRARIANMLRQEEFDTTIANDGPQTLELLRQEVVQLALVDADLPELSGAELVRTAAKEGIRIPIIVCSASKAVGEAVSAMRLGAFHYFTYPLKTGEVVNVVQEAVRERPKSLLLPSHTARQESLGRFAAKIAHDFNNFLTVIRNCSSMLKSDIATDDPSAIVLLDEICQAADRAQAFNEQLFAFAKNKRQTKSQVAIDDIVQRLDKLIQRLVGPNIKIEYQLDAGRKQIYARPAQLEQAVVNLAVNARDASPDGGVITLRTGVEYVNARPNVRSGDYVVLRVEDCGNGMTPETLAKVFEPFFTTKSPDKGTGLGLNIIQEIMLDHGGLVFVDSEVGQGTTVTLMFPLHQNAVVSAPKMHSPRYMNSEK